MSSLSSLSAVVFVARALLLCGVCGHPHHRYIHDELMHKVKAHSMYPAMDDAEQTGNDMVIYERRGRRLADGAFFRIHTDWTYINTMTQYHCLHPDGKVTFAGSDLQCNEQNVLTAEKKAFLEKVVKKAIEWFQTTLRLLWPVDGPLMLRPFCYQWPAPDGRKSDWRGPRISKPDTDFWLTITAAPTTGGTIAYALTCLSDRTTGRPIAGLANFGPNMLDTSPGAWENQLSTAIHEISHALGFSASKFPDFINAEGLKLGAENIVQQFREHGHTVTKIVTPKVKEAVKKQYDCFDWQDAGAEIEDFGGEGAAGSHWEKRLFRNEFMTGTDSPGPVYSAVSLALFEDTGWYKPDYSRAERLQWGSKEGCEFVVQRCNTWSHRYFCSAKGEQGCSHDRYYRAQCSITSFTKPLPVEYSYFEDPKRGGTDSYADYCPFFRPYGSGDCRVAANAGPNLEIWGDTYGENARCWVSTVISKKYQAPTASGRCHGQKCELNPSTGKMELYVLIGKGSDQQKEKFKCPEQGGKINVDGGGYSGTVLCPPTYVQCPKMPQMCPVGPNNRECSGNGVCCPADPPRCVCHPGYMGSACERKALSGRPVLVAPALACDDVLTCGGNGKCNYRGQCECFEGWHGPTCAIHDWLGSPSSFRLVEAPLNEEVIAKLDEAMRIPDSTDKWCVAYVHCLVEPTTNGAIRVRRGGPGKNQLLMYVRFDDAEPPSDKTPPSAGGMGKQPPMTTSVDLPTRSFYHLTFSLPSDKDKAVQEFSIVDFRDGPHIYLAIYERNTECSNEEAAVTIDLTTGICIPSCKHGQCVKGDCQCEAGWTGVDCSQRTCKDDCRGHGRCQTDGVCECYAGYSGDSCQEVIKQYMPRTVTATEVKGNTPRGSWEYLTLDPQYLPQCHTHKGPLLIVENGARAVLTFTLTRDNDISDPYLHGRVGRFPPTPSQFTTRDYDSWRNSEKVHSVTMVINYEGAMIGIWNNKNYASGALVWRAKVTCLPKGEGVGRIPCLDEYGKGTCYCKEGHTGRACEITETAVILDQQANQYAQDVQVNIQPQAFQVISVRTPELGGRLVLSLTGGGHFVYLLASKGRGVPTVFTMDYSNWADRFSWNKGQPTSLQITIDSTMYTVKVLNREKTAFAATLHIAIVDMPDTTTAAGTGTAAATNSTTSMMTHGGYSSNPAHVSSGDPSPEELGQSIMPILPNDFLDPNDPQTGEHVDICRLGSNAVERITSGVKVQKMASVLTAIAFRVEKTQGFALRSSSWAETPSHYSSRSEEEQPKSMADFDLRRLSKLEKKTRDISYETARYITHAYVFYAGILAVKDEYVTFWLQTRPRYWLMRCWPWWVWFVGSLTVVALIAACVGVGLLIRRRVLAARELKEIEEVTGQKLAV
ncbi:unnamed protein product [Vitrella brassicaformis CCMP3155]|uniref:EGF-like domain-containing protein n=3 Tax=Vitrella brassicaformis TaxID=1169539 RepID=A0A0G4EC88_VITBC|nr:unnamed protein product [Vitrella brassicaformis CCMP3155]|eukprot:CEL92958.1 unnamed protein product [Vitrella brassicaformis CCMP3155]